MRNDVTKVDEYKQSTAMSSIHAKETFQVNTFYDGLKREWIYTVILYVQEVKWSMHF